jgi:glycerol-3-phosphate dehydrogenase (NAD(P)+)
MGCIEPRIGVLGAGAWGTALAALLSPAHETVLWCRDRDHALELRMRGENARYLPGVALPPRLGLTADLGAALAGVDVVIGAVPSAATGEVAAAAAAHVQPGATWVSATKGLDRDTHRRMTEVVRALLAPSVKVAALSGPSFAAEVAAGQPTAVVIACDDLAEARRLQALVSGATFRAYASRDVVGVELGGALKNVIAIAAGMLSGLSLGHDPLAALVTRGLHEISVLATTLGADPRTLAGLAGLGDLVLTCTGHLSRNRRLGELIARGRPVAEALDALGHVAEGVDTTSRAVALARAQGVEMPIAAAVDDVLLGRAAPADAIRRLMARQLKDEGQ